MFFAKRRWALRIIEESNLDSSNPIATELVSIILMGSKQLAELPNMNVSDPELILMSAASLRSNQSAKERILGQTQLDDTQVNALFFAVWRAAQRLVHRHKFHELLDSSWFSDEQVEPDNSEIAISFHLEEVEKILSAQRQFEESTKEKIARDLYITYKNIDNSSEKQGGLEGLLAFAGEMREKALEAGAVDYTDPQWNCASLIESIALVELLNQRGQDHLSGATLIREQIEDYLEQHLSDLAKKELDVTEQVPPKETSKFKAYIDDPLKDVSFEEWEIDVQLPREIYNRWKTSEGDVYVTCVYKEGERQLSCTSKEVWESLSKTSDDEAKSWNAIIKDRLD